jgi:uncharacterized protein YkwD
MQAELNLINTTRAQYGSGGLTLDMTMSNGTATCIGALGHSKHMAQVNKISHDQFPADVCGGGSISGENVGEWKSGNELQDLIDLHNAMMSEGDSPLGTCLTGHDCNITYHGFQRVGIGIYYVNGTTWLTTDFTG